MNDWTRKLLSLTKFLLKLIFKLKGLNFFYRREDPIEFYLINLYSYFEIVNLLF